MSHFLYVTKSLPLGLFKNNLAGRKWAGMLLVVVPCSEIDNADLVVKQHLLQVDPEQT